MGSQQQSLGVFAT